MPCKVRIGLLCTALLLAACSNAGTVQQYRYAQMHYEADPDNEKDPEHILTAFHKRLSSDPVLEQWRTEHLQEPEPPNAGRAEQREAISAEAVKPGSTLQALVDDCMAKRGYRAKGG